MSWENQVMNPSDELKYWSQAMRSIDELKVYNLSYQLKWWIHDELESVILLNEILWKEM